MSQACYKIGRKCYQFYPVRINLSPEFEAILVKHSGVFAKRYHLFMKVCIVFDVSQPFCVKTLPSVIQIRRHSHQDAKKKINFWGVPEEFCTVLMKKCLYLLRYYDFLRCVFSKKVFIGF